MQRGKQRYHCNNCGHVFQNERRKTNIISDIWNSWASRKQTYQEIADYHSKELHWVQGILDQYIPVFPILKPQRTCLSIDCSHFGNFLIMLFRSPELKRNLYAKVVRSEVIEEYRAGIEYLMNQGWDITAVITDGKGLRADFFGLPIQMCQFHQAQIVTRYLTRNPRLPANIKLRKLALKLSVTDMESFSGWLEEWHQKHKDFLLEKTLDEKTGRYHYTHPRTRSAYRSLKTNLPYLFTFQKNIKLNIPNTNNNIEGTFSSVKKKVNIHNGLRRDRKIKLIFYLLFGGK